VRAMSESHRRDAASFQNRLDRSRRVRERNRALRDMIASGRSRRYGRTDGSGH
jgi:hypothetical protein